MARIGKADVNRALDHVAKSLVTAGGADGRISRADVKKALPTLTTAEKKLAGAAKNSFVKKCTCDAQKTCETAAAEKKLAGAAKNSFVKKCVKDAAGA